MSMYNETPIDSMRAKDWADSVWETLCDDEKFNPFNYDAEWFEVKMVRESEKAGVDVTDWDAFNIDRFFETQRDKWTL